MKIHLIQLLEKESLPRGVENHTWTAGPGLLDILKYLKKLNKIIVVDAMQPREARETIPCPPQDLNSKNRPCPFTTLILSQALKMAKLLGENKIRGPSSLG